MYTIYTDGAYSSSIDCGGCSAIITQDNKVVKKLYQGYKHTTNNRMELRGVLMALEYFQTPQELEIYSDSSYVVNSINNKHVFRWFEQQDYSKKNLDIWFKIVELLAFHKVVFHWVKGHDDNEMNCLADLYAVHSSQCLNIPIDETVNI